MGIALRSSDELLPLVQPLLLRMFARLRVLLPEAELHHIGATALPGALTKGDLDILVRVSPPAFPAAVEVLKPHFQIKQPANWTPAFASFGDDHGYDLPVGIQVVARDSREDFLLFLRDYFIENPKALEVYNRLKANHSDGGHEDYWRAKDEFLSRILATRRT
jgi:GrpB-like predicted nucleotidyltransferase (UPF0157 family)